MKKETTTEGGRIRGGRISRRRFLGLLPMLAAGTALAGAPDPARAGRTAETGGAAPPEGSGRPNRPMRSGAGAPPEPRGSWEHPEPRPDVDASGVLTAEELAGTPDVIEIYDGIRRIPHIADGIRCHCGCADLPHTRSLLSCYEKDGMARYCAICQGQGRLAYRRWEEGQSLDQIRRAVDARFGPRSGAAAERAEVPGRGGHRPSGTRRAPPGHDR